MMQPRKDLDQNALYDHIIHDWVVFHKKVPIHTFMVMHPRKSLSMYVEHEGDVKGSSTSIQEAQNVILFNRLKIDDSPPVGYDRGWIRELKLAKCRENGRATGTRAIFVIKENSEMYEELEIR
jgi:hypothetical protein